MEHDSRSPFGTLLRRLRRAANLSQEALAERARMSAVTVGALERGIRRAPYRETVDLLLEALAPSDEQAAELIAAAEAGRRKGRPSSESSPGTAELPPSNLPRETTRLIGREADVGFVSSALRTTRLVTLTGPGGVGKTRVALRAAADFAPNARDGTWLVDLAPLSNPESVPEAIASALRIRASGGRLTNEILRDALCDLDVLIVLDNCEHVAGGAAHTVAMLLELGGAVRCIATSRQPLGVAGEVVHRLAPLSVPLEPDNVTAQNGLTYSAFELFVERARAQASGFVSDDSSAPHIGTIVTCLDGLPLAIELAVTKVRALGTAAVAERLENRLRLLTGGSATSPRQQSLRALIDWSYDLLTAQEQALFRSLSVFSGGFTLDAAEEVCAQSSGGDVLDALVSLVEKSLVAMQTVGTNVRYHFLESIHAYARERLAESGEGAALSEAHTRWVASFLTKRDVREMAIPMDARYADLLPELQNVRVALRSSQVSGNVALYAEIAARIGEFFFWNGLAEEGSTWIRGALDALGDGATTADTARLCCSLASLTANVNVSLEASSRALAIAVGFDDPRLLGSAYLRNSLALFYSGRFAEALEANGRALEQCRVWAPHNPLPRAWNLVRRAWILSELRDIDGARACLDEAHMTFMGLRAEREACAAASDLAEVEFVAASAGRSLEIVDAAIPIARRLRDVVQESILLCNRAGYLVSLRDIAEAEATARDAIVLAQKTQSPIRILHATEHLGAARAIRGDSFWACRFLGYVSSAYDRLGYVRETTERSSHDVLLASVREQLPFDEVERLVAEGSRASEAVILAEALTVPEPRDSPRGPQQRRLLARSR